MKHVGLAQALLSFADRFRPRSDNGKLREMPVLVVLVVMVLALLVIEGMGGGVKGVLMEVV